MSLFIAALATVTLLGSSMPVRENVSDGQGQQPPQPRVPAEQQPQPSGQPPRTGGPSGNVQQRIAPGLAILTDDVLFGDVWRRPELSPRDRSLVTISALIATGKPAQLAGHLSRALNNGVQPIEASGVLAHLAIYCGWPSAVSALEVYEQVYTARQVDTEALRTAGPRLAAPASDAARARSLNDELGSVAPKFTQLTNDQVFGDLWRRSDLTLRDRSLVTIAALAAMGDADQLDLYLRRAVESGLTRAQITEAFTHLGFYAGWAKATNGTIFFGSTTKGNVYRAAPGAGQAEVWIQASTTGLTNVLGVLADDKARTLWVCANPTGGRGAPQTGQTARRAFDLESGEPKGSWPFPNGGFCNDIAVADDGTAYVTDTTGRRVLRLTPGGTALEVWVADQRCNGLDGVAIVGSGVYVNCFFSGELFRAAIQPDGSAGTLTEIETSMPFTRPDGLRTSGANKMLQAEGPYPDR